MMLFRLILCVFLCSGIILPAQDIPEPQNLGININSSYEERAPVISPDGKTLYFIRSGHPGNLGINKDHQDIWYSEFIDGGWSKAQNIGLPLSNSRSNGVLSVTPDGNTLVLFGHYLDSEIPYGASITTKMKGGWAVPIPLLIDELNNTSGWYQYYLCNDGKTLLMSIERIDTFGDNDIYVSFLREDGTWTKPKNLKYQINTRGNDITPFLAADGVTLYWSTNGMGGVGDYDVWVSKRLDDTWTNWSEPVNPGPPINTEGFDAYFKIDAAGEYAYYASDKDSFGQNDIFRIKLPEGYEPMPVALVIGRVLSAKDSSPVEALIQYEKLAEKGGSGIARSDPDSGYFKITLSSGYTYGFNAKAENYYGVSDNLDLTDLRKYTELRKDLYLLPIEKNKAYRLNNIFFEFDSHNLKEESFPELDRLFDFLKNNDVNIEISGHTDNLGSNQYNKPLSEKRAESVREYLITKGIDPGRIISKGYGESIPLEDNSTEEGRLMNRRVEFRIIE